MSEFLKYEIEDQAEAEAMLPVPVGKGFTFYHDFVPTVCVFYPAKKSSNTACNGFEMARISDGALYDYKNGGFELLDEEPQKRKHNDIGNDGISGDKVSRVNTHPREVDIARSSCDNGNVDTKQQFNDGNTSGHKNLTPQPPPWPPPRARPYSAPKLLRPKKRRLQ